MDQFRIVKKKDLEKYGEYRTKRVILEEFEKMADDPMLEGVCVPYHERVSVLEHPEKEQPTPPRRNQNFPAPQREEITEPAPKKTSQETITPKSNVKPFQSGSKSQLNFYEDLEKPSDPKVDFNLYKCRGCGKLVMGFSIEEHTRESHGGIQPGYERVK